MIEIETKDFFKEAKMVQGKIFYKGNLGNITNKKITIVGTRKPTEYGKACVRKLLDGLYGFPITIISGLAIGIDSYAHETALKNNLHTIAIPGSSLQEEYIYPKTNVYLANKILENNGALISLWEKQKSTVWTFPARNALMAGIADLVIIIESKIDSGTMITAREATKRGVTVCAIPGNIDNIYSEGPNSLIKNGAKIITNSNDILQLLGIEEKIKLHDDNYILTEIKNGLNNKNNLANKLKIPISELNIELTMLEISGKIFIDNNDGIQTL